MPGRLPVTGSDICLDCGGPFGEGRLRPRRGNGVGMPGLVHLRCYERLVAARWKSGRAEAGCAEYRPASYPLPDRRRGRRRSLSLKPAVARPGRGPLPLDAVCRIEARGAAEACREMLRITRRVFG
jgi:hypothetical protein